MGRRDNRVSGGMEVFFYPRTHQGELSDFRLPIFD